MFSLLEFHITRSSKEIINNRKKVRKMGKSSKDQHNKGEQDFGKGKCEPPNGPLNLISKSSNEFVEDVKAYEKGYENAKRQSKSKK